MTGPAFRHDAVGIRVVFGAGARHGLGAELDRLGLSRVVLVASGRLGEEANAVAAALDHRLTWRVDGVSGPVPAELVARVAAEAASAGADGVVTLGGGSVTGVGRAVSGPALPLVAVPTALGGPETAPGAGQLPAVVVYDPELVMSLPAGRLACSGFHGLANGAEALWAGGASALSAPLAIEGVRALAEALPGAVAEPLDLGYRSRAVVGAAQAALALASAGAGLHHRICDVLVARWGLGAGCHAVVLPYVVGFNEKVLGARAARLAVAVGAGRASTGLHDLALRLGLPGSLEDLGLREVDLDDVVAAVVEEVPANPRPVDADSVRAILTAAWRGLGPV